MKYMHISLSTSEMVGLQICMKNTLPLVSVFLTLFFISVYSIYGHIGIFNFVDL